MLSDLPLAVGGGALMFLLGVAAAALLPRWLTGRFLLGPLIGQAAAGWLAQLAYLAGFPLSGAAATVLAVSALILAARRRMLVADAGEIAIAAALYACTLLGALAVVALTPWPAAGPWSDDWYAYFLQLRTLVAGTPLAGWDLARPPLFAAAAAPFTLVFAPLKALQVSACVVGASTMLTVYWGATALARRGAVPVASLWIVALSPFYLVNLASIVPKLQQGALALAAFLVLRNAREHGLARAVLAGALIALAIGIHQSTVAYGLAFAAALYHAAGYRILRAAQFAAAAGVVVILLAGVPEAMRIVRFGLEEIVRFNPSVAMRSETEPWLLFLINFGSFFGGWGHLLPVWNYVKLRPELTAETWGMYANWFTTVHVALMANCLLLILFPLAHSPRRAARFLAYGWERVPKVVLVGLAAAIPVLAYLTPYENHTGLVHAGATAIALGGFVLGLAWLADAGAGLRPPLLVTVVLGTAWWLGWMIVQDVLVLRAGDVAATVALDDRDKAHLVHIGELAFGQGATAWLPLVLLVLALAAIAALVGLTRRAGAGTSPA